MYTPEEARQVMRDHTWDNREEIVDFILLHDCHLRDVANASLVTLGWDPSAFVMATLLGDRSGLLG